MVNPTIKVDRSKLTMGMGFMTCAQRLRCGGWGWGVRVRGLVVIGFAVLLGVGVWALESRFGIRGTGFMVLVGMV